MKEPIIVPQVGESITEATISAWLKKSGEMVQANDVLLSLDTDKASVEVVAEHSGVLTTSANEGDVVLIGAQVGEIDTAATAGASAPAAAEPKKEEAPAPAAAAAPTPAAPAASENTNTTLSPAVQRVVSENNLNPQDIQGTGPRGRITKEDAMAATGGGGGAGGAVQTITPAAPTPQPVAPAPSTPTPTNAGQRREPMTSIRKRIAERLVMAQQTAAILTTFNEVDMSAVLALRAQYKDKFKEKYGISLGFMGFFVRAAIEALKEFPHVNAYIDGTDIVYNDFYNVGVAVSTEKGLMVPVIKDADKMSLADIEKTIRGFAVKARDGKIGIQDLSGGTFTVTNGGVFGSMMSTPILNPPQSGILGMHAIMERPVAVDGKMEIRPMMYLAFSYDHRMIDGREAVGFLVKIKEYIADPNRLILEI